MKTKEEILVKHLANEKLYTAKGIEKNEDILTAMQEYASQQPTLSKESIMEVLIDRLNHKPNSIVYNELLEAIHKLTPVDHYEECKQHSHTSTDNLSPAVSEQPDVSEELENEIHIILEQFQAKYEWYPKGESKFVMNRKFVSAIIKMVPIPPTPKGRGVDKTIR